MRMDGSRVKRRGVGCLRGEWREGRILRWMNASNHNTFTSSHLHSVAMETTTAVNVIGRVVGAFQRESKRLSVFDILSERRRRRMMMVIISDRSERRVMRRYRRKIRRERRKR